VEPLDPALHGDDLWAAFVEDVDASWTYLTYQRPPDRAAFQRWLVRHHDDPTGSARVVISQPPGTSEHRACGLASFLNAAPDAGSIEVGSVHFAPGLRGTPASTEAMLLMASRVFEVWGYRRYEWKCNAANARSVRAALRLGFSYEGTFRQAAVVKGRNRDTAWFSLLDHEWPAARAGLERSLGRTRGSPSTSA
jgi:RimJ/RimL family protein N-acetyltransferase